VKELIKKILREQVDSQTKINNCNNSVPINTYLSTFALWRTSICNQDTFKKLKEKEKIDERLETCHSQYVGEKLTSEDSCSEKVIDEYSNDGVRIAFNSLVKPVFDSDPNIHIKIDNPQTFNIFNYRLENIKTKEIQKLVSPVEKQITLKSPTNLVNNNIQQKALVDRIIEKIRKRFGI